LRGFTLKDGRLRLAGGIVIPVVWSRDLPSKPSSVRMYQDCLGHWYASFVVRRDRAADRQIIAVEDFKPAFLAKSTMARKAADGAIGAAKRELIERGMRAGRKVVLVSPAYTTMTCSGCFARATQRLGLGVRVFVCAACGYTAGRDENAARVILATVERDRAGVDGVRHAITSPGSGLGAA
jgi:transposase